MQHPVRRRELLSSLGSGLLAISTPPANSWAASPSRSGVITGDVLGDEVGRKIMDDGGNAVDAVVAAALVAGVTNLSNCGIAGYGGHMTIAFADGRTESIDFNSAAPAAITADFFSQSSARGGYLQRGWLSAGVPGVLAGLQLALDRFGSRSLAESMRPAIALARNGFKLPDSSARAIRRLQELIRRDPGSRKLLLPRGKLPEPASTFRNPDLANLLEELAEANSVEPFYRGRIANTIAAAFQKNGGLVTADDLASYQARAVRPVHVRWNGHDIYTAPLTAGGITSLQILKLLDQLEWSDMPAGPERSHVRLEAHRVAWSDRLALFGDPEFVDVPVDHLLSDAYLAERARSIRRAARQQRKVDVTGATKDHGGTCHISAADAAGNVVAMTFTHGQGFGAAVTVDGLGLILGHGVSRFDPRPDSPNAPGPSKRPLNNMCPTVVRRGGKPVLAVGGRGGRRIPNAIACVLLESVGKGDSLETALSAQRLHTEGDDSVIIQGEWTDDAVHHLRSIGFTVSRGNVARVDAASIEPSDGSMHSAFR